ncbi:MAG: hypothetical protein ACP5PB_04870 [Acidimicrobiales bacterium]
MASNSKRILGIHLGLLLAELICISAFIIEIYRALGGNTLSWAYVFEWPIFGSYAVYLWHRLLADERGSTPKRPQTSTEPDSDALSTYNEYLRRVHGNDEPHDEARDEPHGETPPAQP